MANQSQHVPSFVSKLNSWSRSCNVWANFMLDSEPSENLWATFCIMDLQVCWFLNHCFDSIKNSFWNFCSPIIYTFIMFDQLVKRVVFSFTTKTNLFQSSDLVPLVIPISMLIFGNPNPFTVLKIWLQIIMITSFTFHLIGLNAGHHHPDLVHDGDKIRFVSCNACSFLLQFEL